MPRRPSIPSVADLNAAAGGVATLDRALSVLAVFSTDLPRPTLADFATRTRIPKSTVLRMLSSLEHAHVVLRQPDGRYALGPEIARLHAIYAATFSLEPLVMPVLRELVDQTQESAAFYIRQGRKRLCLHRVDSPRPVRDHIRVGDLLPLEQGAGGRVMLAYEGEPGDIYARIRQQQVAILAGDRVAEVAGVAAPVFNAGGNLAGTITLTMPAERLNPAFAQPVLHAARELTTRLGGVFPPAPSGMV
ncbi:IclR family transcriptional regulator [Bordetella genomosp. 7]|uniref:IclR family transcriptional regulator n=1 Tax=Bordetella genomosp. 7 TaxID=1416805 RepID=A0A261QV38_9BORD|nr:MULTISPECIES: IclR family transcriptional regulator [Bordetella]OZI15841.1 IclR family transcriptional regulator [Bordetella genomosp. 7]OZI16591.1 IclR family transcriptional regulator [Bordetella genomosp. 7]